ncbi:MAG: phenylalanine--tRNA ligase subunit alpha, partial [Treponema sp.]|nr:phenylalanine--tRNA ligase subunit alpha [Treponema sp.]
MDIQSVVKNMHPLEVKIIRQYTRGDELTIEKVEGELNFKPGNGNQALSWLLGKGIVEEIRRETNVFFELTELGREWKEKGTPEERMLELVRIQQGLRLPEIAQTLGMDTKAAGSAFGMLSKLGLLGMDALKGVRITLAPEDLSDGRPVKGTAAEHFALLRGLLTKAAQAEAGLLGRNELSEAEQILMGSIAKKRGAADAAFREIDRERVIFGFTPDRDALAQALEAAGITGDEIGTLTAEMLIQGSWKGKPFRSYNMQVPPARL